MYCIYLSMFASLAEIEACRHSSQHGLGLESGNNAAVSHDYISCEEFRAETKSRWRSPSTNSALKIKFGSFVMSKHD